ncbi:MAG: uracil-DNA glycosylase [Rhodocyclaceae bacterium]|nr:uracil-DNA glycosylase [Rhodocyclaceae bacterium]MCP5296590.1 uracil-DNA glycosylase [Zoogloeaceae bacterium]MBX3677672.1 uracil-DNA glycosylase [Rhodocyclaceae bacterium]MCB1891721.1 uracil-DNA glycosylase [Rhodocyclaceae bacterium]MCO5097374.1 uracil-DNA glycosylase [Rhodocyclaceae bacterium]
MRAPQTPLLECRACPRLADFLDDCRRAKPGYHARPVEPFGDPRATLLIVGLAPGYHGANRTGRPFTGDYAGVLLYATLHRYGFASRPESVSADDSLRLIGCRITNAVKCVPPENKPETGEIRTCNRYLANELAVAPEARILLALGLVAHNAVLQALTLQRSAYKFAHGARHVLPDGHILHDSYHCSRYNTQTKRLTEAAFHAVFDAIRADLKP